MNSERVVGRNHALLGMAPIAVLLVSLNLGPLLSDLLGLPDWSGVAFTLLLAVAGYFFSRTILRLAYERIASKSKGRMSA